MTTIDNNTGVEIIRDRYLDNTELVDGIRYTTEEDSNALTNSDFLELMMQEMKMQDPTKPMDSAALMDSQLQMSSIQANQDMSAAMSALQASYATSALATSAGMIGHVVENGTYTDDGMLKSYKVDTIENIDGELYLNARSQIGIRDALVDSSNENSLVLYDADGFIYEGDTRTDNRVSLDNTGRFTFNDDGTLKLLDEDANVITDTTITDKYLFAGSSAVYSEIRDSIAMSSVTQVR